MNDIAWRSWLGSGTASWTRSSDAVRTWEKSYIDMDVLSAKLELASKQAPVDVPEEDFLSILNAK